MSPRRHCRGRCCSTDLLSSSSLWSFVPGPLVRSSAQRDLVDVVVVVVVVAGPLVPSTDATSFASPSGRRRRRRLSSASSSSFLVVVVVVVACPLRLRPPSWVVGVVVAVALPFSVLPPYVAVVYDSNSSFSALLFQQCDGSK